MARVSAKQDDKGSLRRFGEALRNARKAKGMTQDELADASGVERAHVGKIERGERNLTLQNLVRIAEGLGVPLARLMEQAKL